MNTADRVAAIAGPDTQSANAYGLPSLDVPSAIWIKALRTARESGLGFFDWLSAVDELEEGFSVVVHVVDTDARPPEHLLLRTRVPRDDPRLPSATAVYRGASWHERETAEMFGIRFDQHPHPEPLLLPDGFEGYPLRKDFVLAARAGKPWPGAKDPGESEEAADTSGASRRGAPARRRMLPPGVPDPGTWGPRPAEDDDE